MRPHVHILRRLRLVCSEGRPNSKPSDMKGTFCRTYGVKVPFMRTRRAGRRRSRGAVGRPLLSAVGTQAEDREVPDIGVEAVVVVELRHQARRHSHVGLDHTAAISTDEMQVGFLISVMVGRRAMTKMRMTDQAKFFEQVEGSIDGRDVDRGGCLPDLRQDLLGRRMPECLHGLEHQLPLGRQPVAPRPEHALPVGHPGSL
jgi:hypothetical protein